MCKSRKDVNNGGGRSRIDGARREVDFGQRCRGRLSGHEPSRRRRVQYVCSAQLVALAPVSYVYDVAVRLLTGLLVISPHARISTKVLREQWLDVRRMSVHPSMRGLQADYAFAT